MFFSDNVHDIKNLEIVDAELYLDGVFDLLLQFMWYVILQHHLLELSEVFLLGEDKMHCKAGLKVKCDNDDLPRYSQQVQGGYYFSHLLRVYFAAFVYFCIAAYPMGDVSDSCEGCGLCILLSKRR